MNIEKFWEIVDQCKDAEYPEHALADQLDKLSAEEMVIFDHYFRWMEIHAYRDDIWCAAYLLDGGGADDEPIDFIRGLISKGRIVYEQALKNPDSLQALWGQGEIENESFGWAARKAYAKKMGVSTVDAMEVMFGYDGENVDIYLGGELYVAPEMEFWDFENEAENRKRLPGLSKLYYESERSLPCGVAA